VKASLAVLVVDDVEPMRKVTAAQLGALGIGPVHLAASGIDALKLLRTQKIDLVLSDWNMPGMNGIELLGAMRADPAFERIPFVMITAEAQRSRIEDAIAQGVSDLLVKPYTSARLATCIDRAMASRRRPPAAALSTVTAAAPPAAKPADKLTILLVDDTADNLHLLVNIFKDDYRILAADSGKKALDVCFSDKPPDLVLLDVMMPGMDGFEVAQRMREHPNAEGIPVIFVTAMNDDDARTKGLSLGAVDFVTKPVNPTFLRLRVNNFMRYILLRREMQADYDRMLEVARLREVVEDITRNDIRGPLSTVLSVLQGLSADKELQRRHGSHIDSGEQATLQLLSMLNLSSELYKIESGRYQHQAKPVAIVDIVRRVVQLARTAFEQRKLTIAVDSDGDVGVEPPHASGDAMLMFSIVQNLVWNACEATPDRGRVSVTLVDDTPLRIAIVNKGAVPAQIRPHVFDKYATFGKTDAAGLGAYSAQVMARAQQGDVTMTVSDQDDTTTMVITLPRDATSS
jgi:two-component system sensor histidine kinase/response regulator